MRINIWIILAALLALLIITRYLATHSRAIPLQLVATQAAMGAGAAADTLVVPWPADASVMALEPVDSSTAITVVAA